MQAAHFLIKITIKFAIMRSHKKIKGSKIKSFILINYCDLK